MLYLVTVQIWLLYTYSGPSRDLYKYKNILQFSKYELSENLSGLFKNLLILEMLVRTPRMLLGAAK